MTSPHFRTAGAPRGEAVTGRHRQTAHRQKPHSGRRCRSLYPERPQVLYTKCLHRQFTQSAARRQRVEPLAGLGGLDTPGGSFRTPSVSEGPDPEGSAPQGGRSLTVAVLKEPSCAVAAQGVTDLAWVWPGLLVWVATGRSRMDDGRLGLPRRRRHVDRRDFGQSGQDTRLLALGLLLRLLVSLRRVGRQPLARDLEVVRVVGHSGHERGLG